MEKELLLISLFIIWFIFIIININKIMSEKCLKHSDTPLRQTMELLLLVITGFISMFFLLKHLVKVIELL